MYGHTSHSAHGTEHFSSNLFLCFRFKMNWDFTMLGSLDLPMTTETGNVKPETLFASGSSSVTAATRLAEMAGNFEPEMTITGSGLTMRKSELSGNGSETLTAATALCRQAVFRRVDPPDLNPNTNSGKSAGGCLIFALVVRSLFMV